MDVGKVMKNALLVDDEPDICDLLCAMLRRLGTKCDSAHSLEQGRKAVRSGKYDAVFLDVHLPDGLGYDLIDDIKVEQPDAMVVAIIAIEQERSRAVEAGADLFVPKPFDRSTIFASVRDLGFYV
jgi:DNA-binding response OmpR family regulator